MSLKVTRVDVWAARVADSPGGLAKVLGVLRSADANLECVIARRDSAEAATGSPPIRSIVPVSGSTPQAASAHFNTRCQLPSAVSTASHSIFARHGSDRRMELPAA